MWWQSACARRTIRTSCPAARDRSPSRSLCLSVSASPLCRAALSLSVQPTAPWKHVEVTRRTGQASVGQRATAAQRLRRPFYCENDDRGPPEYQTELEEEHARLRARAADAGRTPWHSGGIYDEDARQPMTKEPEPAPLTPDRGSGRKHAPGADRGRAPWEARDAELYVERGKAPPRGVLRVALSHSFGHTKT